jgi:hypothetical protein
VRRHDAPVDVAGASSLPSSAPRGDAGAELADQRRDPGGRTGRIPVPGGAHDRRADDDAIGERGHLSGSVSAPDTDFTPVSPIRPVA